MLRQVRSLIAGNVKRNVKLECAPAQMYLLDQVEEPIFAGLPPDGSINLNSERDRAMIEWHANRKDSSSERLPLWLAFLTSISREKINIQAPATESEVTPEDAVKFYTQMQTIRRMELKADQLYKQKGLHGENFWRQFLTH